MISSVATNVAIGDWVVASAWVIFIILGLRWSRNKDKK